MTERRLPKWLTPSAGALILANLVPLYGVVALGWKVFPLVLLFWLENVILGGLNVVRLLTLRPGDAMHWAVKLFAVPFFTFHYGMFTLVHGVFVFALFGGDMLAGSGAPTPALVTHAVGVHGLWPAVLALTGSHVFSFFWNYLGKGENKRLTIGELMVRPYARIVVLHVALIGSGFLVMMLGSPTAGLVLLLALKTAMDLVAHTLEHRSSPPERSKAQAG